jgi:hypothetical protein
MKNSVLVAAIVFLAGTVFGFLLSNMPLALATANDRSVIPSEVTFVVSVDEVAQNFVFGERFTGRYEKTVTMSDGSEREIILTPMEKDGRLTVKFQDGQGHTYMGPNGWTYNGELLVNLRNYDQIGPSQNN